MDQRKPRLDQLLVEKGLVESREKAQGLILAGKVWSNNQRLEKAGLRLDPETPLEVEAPDCPFVSRAGMKLEHALATFGVDVSGRICLDVGASTGGFTDCLLKRGAGRVVAVDVGYGQIHESLRTHPQVTLLEKTNARHMEPSSIQDAGVEADSLSLGVADVSFISLRTILGAIVPRFPSLKEWVVLFKPQFEVGPENVGKGGLVSSSDAVERSLAEFDAFVHTLGFLKKAGPERSPLSGKKSGNVEYLFHYARI